MPVQALSCAVVAHRRSRVSVRGRFLNVAERDTGVEGGGDERVPQRVRADALAHTRPFREAPDDPRRGVTIEPSAVHAEEDRTLEPVPDGEIDGTSRSRRERDGHDLAALPADQQHPVAPFETEILDVGSQRFRDPKPVQPEQRCQRMVPR